ncbi:MAG TPA: DUF2269 domain-containing protein [Candidatus Thermoplasmatota archaeon]|nr:DUF2269 domain-containing protein [Candidatus Thermoplasmatota archaeon]
MVMTPQVRQIALIAHVAASVGWIGAVAAFIVLDVATVVRDDVPVLRACYLAMDLITTWAIVPLAFAALVTGILMSLGTKWGLFRHWWTVVTLALTIAATAVLLVQLPIVSQRAAIAADPMTSDAELRGMGNLLLHSIGGAVVLLVITALNIVKPRGLTTYGWRRQKEAASLASESGR